MDDHDLFLLCSAAILSLLAITFLRLLKPPSSRRLPPGPRNLPVIGSAHRLVDKLPHRALRDLADVHGPLMSLRVGQIPVVVVTSKEVARQVLKTHDAVFATRPKLMAGGIVAYNWEDILFSPTGDYWRKLRKLCNQEILSAERIYPLLPAYQGGRGTYVQGPCMVYRSIYHDSPGIHQYASIMHAPRSF
jgi:hypothetical protein